MKLLHFALPLSIPALALTTGMLVTGQAMTACGGSSAAASSDGGGTTNNGQDSSTGSNNGGGDGSTPTSGNDAGGPPIGSNDAGFTIPDGGFTLPPAEAGSLGAVLPGDAGEVQCGAIACDVSANTCCAFTDGGTSCISGATATCPQAAVHCAQTADCTGSQVCCGVVNITNVSLVASCSAGPCNTDQDTPPGAQLCASDADCTSGVKCTKQSCQGETLQLCGLFDYANPLVSVKCTAE